MNEKYLDYYQKFRDLRNLHKALEFGNNPPIPEVFSQNICKHIFSLEEWYNTKADAKTEDGKAIEIKATGTDRGKTTIDINSILELGEQFSGLYWLYFDFDADELITTFMPKTIFGGIEPAPNNRRNNISLGRLIDDSCSRQTHDIITVLKKC